MGVPGGETVSEPPAALGALEKPAGAAILCTTCGSVCRGEVLRVQSKYFHLKCFVCKVCGCDLAEGGFFVRQGQHICTRDYQRLYGTRCFACDRFIEGEVVSALGRTYHPDCFVCAACRLPFPPGDRVTFNGKECMCQKCSLPKSTGGSAHLSQGLWSCGGCGAEIKNGQSLVALDKHWHLGCFKCKTCGKELNAEYISKDGLPYCEADYHAEFGIRCDGCEKYITGHVLEAGEKHYHPLCALCVRCGRMFAEGEEMYLQGSSIWHPACRQAARTEDKSKMQKQVCPGATPCAFQETRTSSESIISGPASSTSGSPSRVIYARLGDEILDYRDLAALPKSKAIYNIDRPDMISYSPYVSHAGDRPSGLESPPLLSPPPTEGDQDDRSSRQCRTSSPSSAGSVSLGRYTPTSRSPQHYSRPGSESGRSTPSLSVLSDGRPPATYQQAPRHFHVPDTGVKDNIYRKPPIYKQHASRRLDGEDGGSDQDGRKQKGSWLILQGDTDTRTDSPDSQALSHSSGADRDPLSTGPGAGFYSQRQCGALWSRPGCQLGHTRIQGLSLRRPHRHKPNPREAAQRRGPDQTGETPVARGVPGGVRHERGGVRPPGALEEERPQEEGPAVLMAPPRPAPRPAAGSAPLCPRDRREGGRAGRHRGGREQVPQRSLAPETLLPVAQALARAVHRPPPRCWHQETLQSGCPREGGHGDGTPASPALGPPRGPGWGSEELVRDRPGHHPRRGRRPQCPPAPEGAARGLYPGAPGRCQAWGDERWRWLWPRVLLQARVPCSALPRQPPDAHRTS
ncbi:actin-binding LIM protein 2 isoform X6 [Pipistrellus kuhlii]|uniref:actin-binding LIM protein 2 isoform X6 n=1 Tax=Pipistrellus kuhlii TaxID=59472 RepID=UPI001E26F7FF|nr:actin-binding LIM protein 2 isoform X6 [Pipistrellus kuhlii]